MYGDCALKSWQEIWNVSIDGQGKKRVHVQKNHPIVKDMKRYVEATCLATPEDDGHDVVVVAAS
jgi:hypothetical protein